MGKSWYDIAASNYLYLFLYARVCSLLFVFFKTFQLKHKTGMKENCTIGILLINWVAVLATE